MKKILLPALAAFCMAGPASAQFYFPMEQPLPNLTSVTNEGVAVGYNDQNCPFYIWDAVNGTMKLIGGISAGQGVGGNPHFPDNGKFVAAPMQSDNINVYTAWTQATVDNMKPYIFSDICYMSDYNLFAIGNKADGSGGFVFKSTNNGLSWQKNMELTRPKPDGSGYELYDPDFLINCIATHNDGSVIIGCSKGKLLFSRGNGSWSDVELEGFGADGKLEIDSPIDTYMAMSYVYSVDQWETLVVEKGCVLAKLEDGSYVILYSLDKNDVYDVCKDFAANAISLGNNGTNFFLGTSDGMIQISKDGGATWTNALPAAMGRPVSKIVFSDFDKSKGIALTDNVVYITNDGGETWTETPVFGGGIGIGMPQTSSWQDAVWYEDWFVIVGTDGNVYKSDNNGESFTKVSGFMGDLGAIYYDKRKVCTIIGQEGMVWRKQNVESFSGYTAGLYDVEADTWTPLIGTGNLSDASASSPWGISGDGNHVVGLVPDFKADLNKVVECAAVWDGIDKLTVLDNRMAESGRACRANAVSYDGSVVVGWQDVWGPWYGSIWRKGDDGAYKQTILSNGDKTQDEIDYTDKADMNANFTGMCQCVTPDGKFVGGRGIPGLAVDGAWIWNEDTGFKVLIPDTDATVSDMNSDATMAIGWEGPGSGAWIWTEERGKMMLQDYVTEKLGYDIYDKYGFVIASVYDMSPNGRYVCGYGFIGMDPVGYVFDLFATSGIEEMQNAQVKASVYPNPVSDELHVDLPFSFTEINTTVALYDMNGGLVRKLDRPSTSNVIDIRGIAKGIYLLDVNANGKHKSFKVMVK